MHHAVHVGPGGGQDDARRERLPFEAIDGVEEKVFYHGEQVGEGSKSLALRLEFRAPDPSCNPYLAFAAQLMAGLDGIRNRIEPPEPVDKDLYELPPEEALGIEKVPASLDAVLDRLEVDHDYLVEGGVFTPDLIETWIEYKREFEIDPIRLRPHPHEFAMYYDI